MDIIFSIKQLLQKVFRPSHISDIENWNASYYIAKDITKRLLAYQKLNRHGIPYSCVKEKRTQEENSQEWEDMLNEMIFAFEFHSFDDMFFEGKKAKKFLEKYGYESPYKETEENKYTMYTYKLLNKDLYQMTEEPDLHIKSPEEYQFESKADAYRLNSKLLQKMTKRANKGRKLFAEHFPSLWD